MKMVWDESVIGRNRFWMKVSLDETVFGWKCHWMNPFLDESVIGWNCLLFWMKWFWTKVFLDESVFGWKCFWMKVFLDEFFFCNLDESVPNHSIISASNKNFPGNWKELVKILGPDEETESQFYWQFHRIWQSLWRPIMESLYVNTSPFRD